VTALLRADTDYAVRLLMALAESSPDVHVPVKEIAGVAGVPLPIAHKIVQKLRATGSVTCQRGPKGGIKLVRAPHEITIFDVVVSIQGRPGLCRCLIDQGACERHETCRLSKGLSHLQSDLERLLDQTTLEDLLGIPVHEST